MVSAVSGDVGGSAKKVGKRIKKLERIYGIKNGNNQHSSLPNNSEPSQSDLAMRMGMSVDTLRNYKMLADMIPELSPHKKDTAGKLSIGALCLCIYSSISAKSI